MRKTGLTIAAIGFAAMLVCLGGLYIEAVEKVAAYAAICSIAVLLVGMVMAAVGTVLDRQREGWTTAGRGGSADDAARRSTRVVIPVVIGAGAIVGVFVAAINLQHAPTEFNWTALVLFAAVFVVAISVTLFYRQIGKRENAARGDLPADDR
jgi:cytochrome bd-type quinol oxidase subunit 2